MSEDVTSVPPTPAEAFEAFLLKKKIATQGLQQANPTLYAQLQDEFEALGPKAFDQRRKFYFNDLRLRFPLVGG